MFYWALTDLYCNTIGVFDQRLPGSQVVWPHCSQRRATLQLSLEEDLIAAIHPLRTALYCEYKGEPIFHGPILNPAFKGAEGRLEIQAVDAAEWLIRGYHWSAASRLNTIQEDIVWASVNARNYDLDSSMGVYLGRVVKGVFTSSGIRRDVITDAGVNCWQPILDMNNLLDGTEFELEPLRPDQWYDRNDGSGRKCAAWARINAGQVITGTGQTSLSGGGQGATGRTILSGATYPGAATMLRGDEIYVPPGTPEFEFGFGQDNASDMQYLPNGGAVKNKVNARGQAPDGGGAQPTGQAYHVDSRSKNGMWEGWESTSYTTNAIVTAHAQQQAAAYGNPLEEFVIVPAMEWMENKKGEPYGHPPEFGVAYSVGDIVSGEGQFGAIRQKVLGRVTQATLTEVDTQGNVKVDLACIPRVIAGGIV